MKKKIVLKEKLEVLSNRCLVSIKLGYRSIAFKGAASGRN